MSEDSDDSYHGWYRKLTFDMITIKRIESNISNRIKPKYQLDHIEKYHKKDCIKKIYHYSR